MRARRHSHSPALLGKRKHAGRSATPAREPSAEPVPAGDGDGARVGEPVVITGAAVGLPGAERMFDESHVGRLLNGEQGIDVIPSRLRHDILDKHITRLVKSEDGGASFEAIDRLEDVIKLAGRAGAFDPSEEFGIDRERARGARAGLPVGDRRRHRRAP